MIEGLFEIWVASDCLEYNVEVLKKVELPNRQISRFRGWRYVGWLTFGVHFDLRFAAGGLRRSADRFSAQLVMP